MNYFEFNAKKQGPHAQEVHDAALPALHDPTVTAIREAIRKRHVTPVHTEHFSGDELAD